MSTAVGASWRTARGPAGRSRLRPVGPAERMRILQVYRGGHLELAADAERMASAVETFLNAGLTVPPGPGRPTLTPRRH
jgi:hypothetical protein